MNRLNLSGMDQEALCELLHELCKTHDWFFQMSDDYGAWHRGDRHASKIDHVRGVLDGMGFGTTADTIIGDYKPKTKIGH